MEHALEIQALLQTAGSIFQNSTGCSAVFFDPVLIKSQRSVIVRCRIKSVQSDVSSVIIKEINKDPIRGFSDWTSLAFLSELPEARDLVPHFYGGDLPKRIFVIEDLGEGKSLQNILGGNDLNAAHTALQTMASQMARLHAATIGKQDLFEAFRSTFPKTGEIGHQQEAKNWLDSRGKVLEWFKALDCVPPVGLDNSLEFIFDIYRQPGGFLAFTHGDPAPSNNHFVDGKTRLLDFEYGSYRHVLYDITAWNILCPLPTDCVREMTRCFRQELAIACPTIRDEVQFSHGWACLCAYRTLAILTWIPPDVIGRNRPWADNWTMREAVFVALSRLRPITAPYAQLEPVSEAADVLIKALLRTCPQFEDGETLPQWSALK